MRLTNMLRQMTCGALVLALSGCSSLKNTIEPDRIVPLPGESVPVPQTLKDTNGVRCGLSPATTTDGSIPTEIERFTQAMYCAYSVDASQQGPWIRRFVEKGVTLSDQTCGLFFDTLERRRIDASYAQTNMNIGGTAVTAILTAAGQNARSAFNVATALAFGNAWFENYKGNFVLTPQLGKLHEKLKTDLRKPIGDRIKERAASGEYASFDLAKVDLQEYDELCSHKSIVLLLERSVEAAQIRTFASGPTLADIEQAEVLEAELFSLANPGVSGAFAKGEVEELYVVAMTGRKERRLLVALAMAKLDSKVAPYLKNLKLDADAPDPRGVAYLTSIGKLRLLNDSDKVRKVRMEVDLQVEADQKTPVAGGGQPTPPSGPTATSAQPQAASQAADQAEQKARASRLAAIRNSSSSKEQSVSFGYEVVKPSAPR